jgi:polygalacturonase
MKGTNSKSTLGNAGLTSGLHFVQVDKEVAIIDVCMRRPRTINDSVASRVMMSGTDDGRDVYAGQDVALFCSPLLISRTAFIGVQQRGRERKQGQHVDCSCFP